MPPTQSTTLSSRDFNQDTARAKRAAQVGPVYVTDRGTPRYVLLSYEHYCELAGGPSLAESLSRTPGVGSIDFELTRRSDRAVAPSLD